MNVNPSTATQGQPPSSYYPVYVGTLTERSGFTTLLWAIAGLVLDFWINILPGVDLPEWMRPVLPVLLGVMGLLRAHAKSKSVPAASLQNPMLNVTPTNPKTGEEVQS